MGIEDRKVL